MASYRERLIELQKDHEKLQERYMNLFDLWQNEIKKNVKKNPRNTKN